MRKINFFLSVILLFTFQACSQHEQKSKAENVKKSELKLDDNFGSYWYQGKAELSSYDLTQVRYGEKREGHAVLVFVTEDFSKSKQVKLDNPSASSDDAQKVLKLNFTKKFNTGIYPYSIMSSVFNPVYPEGDLHAVKLTTSVQEWCGHVFMQFNKKETQYELDIRSYFESEGDQDRAFPISWVEDELWNLLRLNPSSIPSGNVKIIPSNMYLRLKHKEAAAYKASIEKDVQGNKTQLIIKYPDLERTLKITYENKFPYQINSWEEAYPENGEMMTTTGKLRERILLDYWNKNSIADSVYRDQLGLD